MSSPRDDVERAMLRPRLDEDSRPFWEACAAGELRVQACTACGRRRFPPRPLCPHCRSYDHEWDRLSGLGTIWSVAIPHPPLLPGYRDLAPYNVIVVSLHEDPALRMVGNLVRGPGAALDSVPPHDVRIGESVQVTFGAPVDGIALPQWVRRP